MDAQSRPPAYVTSPKAVRLEDEPQFQGTYIEPHRRMHIERMKKAQKNISTQPPNFFGLKNRNYKNLFSTFEYLESSQDTNAVNKRTVDKNGCPIVHRGLTSIRRRNPEGGVVGTGAPKAWRSMSHYKDDTWMANPQTELTVPTEKFRRVIATADEIHSADSRSPAWRGGASKGGLFDAPVRPNAPNDTAAPDRQLLSWVTPMRVPHTKPFAGTSVASRRDDHSFVSGHAQFPHYSHEYEPSEKVIHATVHGFPGKGHRETCSHLHIWRPTTTDDPIDSSIDRDRNPQYEAIQSPTERGFHNTARGRAEREADRAAYTARTARRAESEAAAATSGGYSYSGAAAAPSPANRYGFSTKGAELSGAFSGDYSHGSQSVASAGSASSANGYHRTEASRSGNGNTHTYSSTTTRHSTRPMTSPGYSSSQYETRSSHYVTERF